MKALESGVSGYRGDYTILTGKEKKPYSKVLSLLPFTRIRDYFSFLFREIFSVSDEEKEQVYALIEELERLSPNWFYLALDERFYRKEKYSGMKDYPWGCQQFIFGRQEYFSYKEVVIKLGGEYYSLYIFKERKGEKEEKNLFKVAPEKVVTLGEWKIFFYTESCYDAGSLIDYVDIEDLDFFRVMGRFYIKFDEKWHDSAYEEVSIEEVIEAIKEKLWEKVYVSHKRKKTKHEWIDEYRDIFGRFVVKWDGALRHRILKYINWLNSSESSLEIPEWVGAFIYFYVFCDDTITAENFYERVGVLRMKGNIVIFVDDQPVVRLYKKEED